MTLKKSLSALFFGICLAGTAHAESHEHEHHSHDHHAAEAEEAKLTLNNGAKWATDQPLRENMAAIRKLAGAASQKAVLSAAEAAALGRKVEGHVTAIINSCHLEPQADAQLHIVLARMLDGANELKSKAKAAHKTGLGKINKALVDFDTYFDAQGK